MCGIFGAISRRQPIERERLLAARDTLKHRGPDDAGAWFSNSRYAALTHRRLSFLDLHESGRQPLCNEDGTLWLTFNGEIYNYIELRAELQAAGHVFRTQTDSEVLLHAYEQWGAEMLQQLKGMFAFALWDDNRGELFAARDRFGIKPFYYLHTPDEFAFASEIKALSSWWHESFSLNEKSVAAFLAYRYIPSPDTIWKEVNKLPPAHQLIYHADSGTLTIKEYWQLQADSKRVNEKTATEMFDELLLQSVATHIRSDVRIGAFLSGGFDSSAMAFYLQRLNYATETFSIGFHDWNESEHRYAQAVATHLGFPNRHLLVGNEQLDLLPKLMYHYDEPIADISIIPTYEVSRLAAGSVKAVLSGEGADEFLAGYTWQRAVTEWSRFWPLLPTSLQRWRLAGYYAQSMAMGLFDDFELQSCLHPRLHEHIPKPVDFFYRNHYKRCQHPLKAVQRLDVKTFMGELVLTKIDRSSMAHSLEVRVPFLDHEMAEWLFALHPSVYFNTNKKKALLHNILQPVLPAHILNRPKQGFVGPDVYYMNIEWYRTLLTGSLIESKQIVQGGYIQALLQTKQHWKLWKLAVLEQWARIWLR